MIGLARWIPCVGQSPVIFRHRLFVERRQTPKDHLTSKDGIGMRRAKQANSNIIYHALHILADAVDISLFILHASASRLWHRHGGSLLTARQTWPAASGMKRCAAGAFAHQRSVDYRIRAEFALNAFNALSKAHNRYLSNWQIMWSCHLYGLNMWLCGMK